MLSFFTKILTFVLSAMVLMTGISCADSYPTLNNAALLALIGEGTESSDPSAQSGSLFIYSPNLLVTTESGGTAEAQIYLRQAPSSDVTISFTSSNAAEGTVLTSSLTFTSLDYSIPQTLQILGVDDALPDGNVSYRIDAAVTTSDPVFSAEASFSIAAINYDNETSSPGILVTPTSGLYTTEGGGSAVFSVVLLTAPSADVTLNLASSDTNEAVISTGTLTFTSANWSTPQDVTVTGVNDVFADGDKNFTISFDPAVSADASYNGITASSVTGTNYDNDSAGILVNGPDSTTVSESGTTSTFTIRLSSAPTGGATVTIPLSSGDTSQATVSPSSLSFTDSDWSTPQTVTISAVDDLLPDGTATVTITIGSSVSDDTDFSGLVPSPSSYTYTVLDNEAASVTPGFLVTPDTGLITTEAGGTAVFSVVLQSQPTANVTLPVASSNTAEGTISTGSIVFTSTDWDVPQSITITGVDDAAADGNISYSINLGPSSSTDSNYNNLTPPAVGVTNTDNETPGITVSSPSQTFITEGGSTATFSVSLQSQPAANVTIPLSSSDTTEGTVSPASLTFTSANWMTAQTVTVTGVDDALTDGHVSFTVTIGAASSADGQYNGINPADLSFTNLDNEPSGPPGILVTPTTGLITTESGGSAVFSVVLLNKPNDSVTIPVASSNTAEGTVSAASLTFTPLNWNTPQNITVTGVNDDFADGNAAYSIQLGMTASTDASYNGLTPSSVNVTNYDNDTAGIIVSSPSSGVTSESATSVSFEVRLQSKPKNGATISIPVSVSDASEATITAPFSADSGNLTFNDTNWSVAQVVTVTGVDDGLTDGQISYTIVIGASVSDTDPDYSGINPADISLINLDNETGGSSPGFYIAPASGLVTTESGGTAVFSVVLLAAPTADVTLPAASSNTAEGTVSAASLTFTAGNWNIPQNVTITGADDSVSDGNQAYTIDFGPSSSTDGNYNNLSPASVSVTNYDNDTPGVTVSPATNDYLTENGTVTATFTVALTSQPASDVDISFSIDLPARAQFTAPVAGSSFTMTFTTGNWNTPQPVTVIGVDNLNATGNLPVVIQTGNTVGAGDYNNMAVPDVNLTLIDDETAGISILPNSASAITVQEGLPGAAVYVVLNSKPLGNVTIPVSLGGAVPGAGSLSTASLTFTDLNWNISQVVTVTAVNDTLRNGSRNFSVIFGDVTSADSIYDAFTTFTRNFIALDNDKYIYVTTSPISGNMSQGTGATSIAKADHICNNATYGYPGSGTYKALLGHTTLRAAYPTRIDWPLYSNASYLRLSDSVVSFTTNNNAVFDFGPTFTENSINAVISTTDRYIWTGFWYDWMVSANNCVNWTSNAGGQSAEQGRTIYLDYGLVKALSYACNDAAAYMVCVEQ